MTTDGLMMKGGGSQRQQWGSGKLVEAAPWGGGTWQGARGGPLSPLLSMGLGSRQLGGAARGGGGENSFSQALPHMLQTLGDFPRATPKPHNSHEGKRAVSILQARLHEVN